MGHLVGEHPVLAEVQDGVAGGIAEVAHRVEHVDGQAFERAVHAGEAQHGIGVARCLVQQRLLAELADLRAHVVAELAADLDVASFVPALPGHVELQRERRFVAAVAGVEVPARPAGAFERLDLADEDAVHQTTSAVGRLVVLDAEAALALLAVAGVARIEDDVFDLDPFEALVSSQLVNRQDPLHREKFPLGLTNWSRVPALRREEPPVTCHADFPPGRAGRMFSLPEPREVHMCWSSHRDFRDAWAAERAIRSDVRVSDADRQTTIDLLSRHTGEGRLTLEEFEARVDEALGARTHRDLRRALRELPVERPSIRRRYSVGMIRAAALWAFILVVAVIAIGPGVLWWLVPLAFFRFGGFRGHHHHDRHEHPRHLDRGDDLTLV